MEKKSAIYAPGELGRVRENLGDLDNQEAMRMAELLGGEVGVEREEPPKPIPKRTTNARIRREPSAAGRRRDDVRPFPAQQGDALKAAARQKKANAALDDPSVPINVSYRERVRMDRYAGDSVFEIKSLFQVLHSVVSVFNEIPDRVNPAFINKRMSDYYKKIEILVTATRTLLPRNKLKRNEQLKKISPFAFSVLDTIRQWNIERIASELARIQARPRKILVVELSDILKMIYKPLFVLEKLDIERHIKEAYKILYKILYLEELTESIEKYQELIRVSIKTLSIIRREVRFLLYPLLLKLLSDRFLSYDQFFIERRNRYLAFIDAREEDSISPALAEFEEDTISAENETPEEKEGEAAEDEPENSDEEEKKERHTAATSEHKAVDRGLQTLEMLFPKAGWENMSSFPDFYPYFSDIFNLKRNYDLIAPTDPLQQVMVLTRILEELFFGLRFVKFGVVLGSNNNPENINEAVGTILNNWSSFIEVSFDSEYLPRLAEYCRILDSSVESKSSGYAKRLLNELHWIKRFYFLPYYKFDTLFQPPPKKDGINALYSEVRRLRKYLTAVAAGIEQGNKQGGAEKKVFCDSIDNPWTPYVFQVANPVSTRLDALLKNPKQKTNASLVFFALAIITVLDHIINNENSWAYENASGPLFRSAGGEGITPLYRIDDKVDTNALFKASLKQAGDHP
jgi:hypothetical protein